MASSNPPDSSGGAVGPTGTIGPAGPTGTAPVPDPRAEDLTRDPLLAPTARDMAGRPMLKGISLLKKLGQGGMGAVYLAAHPRLGIDVAVKVLPFHLAEQNPQSIEYFLREARVAVRLNHPNIVRIFDVDLDGQIYFLVMEYVHGVTAGALMRERAKSGNRPMSEVDALDIIIAACEGLSIAHDENMVHRDIKPDNIIIPVDEKGVPQLKRAKLMDLGLAKDIDAGEKELTATNLAMGTPGYMSPEQAESAKTAAPSADIFSMGATLYALLTGVAPFAGTTVLNVLRRTSDEPHKPVRTLNPSVSEGTGQVVDICLEKKPEKRFPNARVLTDSLRECRSVVARGGRFEAAGEPTVIRPPAGEQKAPEKPPEVKVEPKPEPTPEPKPEPKPKPPPLVKPRRRGGCLMVFSLLLFVGALGAGVWWFMTQEIPFREAMARADEHEKKREWAQACKVYEGALAKFPFYRKRAQSRLDESRRKADDEELFRATLQEARRAEVDEQWDRAEELYEKVLEIRGGASEAVEALVRVREVKRQIVNPAVALGKALEAGRNALAAKKWDEAIQAFDKALTLDANSVEAKKGREEAIRARDAVAARDGLMKELEKALAPPGIDPDVVKQVVALIDSGKLDEAEKLLDGMPEGAQSGLIALRQRITNLRRFNGAMHLGGRAQDGERWAEALEEYTKAQRIATEGDLSREAGVALEAIEGVRRLTTTRIQNAIKAARGHFEKGELEKALGELEQAISIDPKNEEARGLAHQILIEVAHEAEKKGNREEAIAAAQRALELNPDSEAAKEILNRGGPADTVLAAKQAIKEGKRKEALELARTASKIDPKTPGLQEVLEELWAERLVEGDRTNAAGPVDELLLSSDGTMIFGSGAGYPGAGAWHAGDLKPIGRMTRGVGPSVQSLSQMPGQRRLVALSGGAAGWSNIALVEPGKMGKPDVLTVKTHGIEMPIRGSAVAVAPDGSGLIIVRFNQGGRDGSDYYSVEPATMAGLRSGEPVIERHQTHARITIAPDGGSFATGGGTYDTYKQGTAEPDEKGKIDARVYLWMPGGRWYAKQAVEYSEAYGEVRCLRYSTDSRYVIAGTANGRALVVDVAERKLAKDLAVGSGQVVSVASDGVRVAIGIGGKLKVISLATENVTEITRDTLGRVRTVLFLPDGEGLVVATEGDSLVKLKAAPIE